MVLESKKLKRLTDFNPLTVSDIPYMKFSVSILLKVFKFCKP